MEIPDSFDEQILNLDDLQNNECILKSKNTGTYFKIIINFTNYINHFLTVKAIKFDKYINDRGIIKKTFLIKYNLKELQQLTQYFGDKNSINDIYKDILKCFKERSLELFENTNGITIIFSISNFGDYDYKIPFLLLPFVEEPVKMENSDKIEERKIDDSQNNTNTMVGNKRLRNPENLEKSQNKIIKKDNNSVEEKKVSESMDINENETQNNKNTFDNVE